MILSLFRKPTGNPASALYRRIVAEARRPEWFRNAGVPDSMDGRYCVLATLLALTDLRLAEGGEPAQALSPRLTELFVADMDAQLCQSGLGDPTLGKTVRGMVAGVSARIVRWRDFFVGGPGDWAPVMGFSLYRSAEIGAEQQAVARRLIEEWRFTLAGADDERLTGGL